MFVQRDEGASVMGLTLAQYGEITYKNGRVEQGNFNDFQLARINESPTETRVRIVEHGIDVPASGVGEPGVPPLANRQSALDLSSDGGQRVRPPPKTLPAPSGRLGWSRQEFSCPDSCSRKIQTLASFHRHLKRCIV